MERDKEPLEFKAQIDGGWSYDSRGERDFRLTVRDANNRARICEIVAPQELVVDWLSNTIRGDKEATVRFYGVECVGMERQHLAIAISLDGYGQEALDAALTTIRPLLDAGGWRADERFNHHQAMSLGYVMNVGRYAPPGTPIEPEIEAMRRQSQPKEERRGKRK